MITIQRLDAHMKLPSIELITIKRDSADILSLTVMANGQQHTDKFLFKLSDSSKNDLLPTLLLTKN